MRENEDYARTANSKDECFSAELLFMVFDIAAAKDDK
jgi:hypothetical protein